MSYSWMEVIGFRMSNSNYTNGKVLKDSRMWNHETDNFADTYSNGTSIIGIGHRIHNHVLETYYWYLDGYLDMDNQEDYGFLISLARKYQKLYGTKYVYD